MLEEFFGYNGFAREPEGFLSWQHLTFVMFLTVCMTVLAIIFARKNREKDERAKNRALIWAAFVMDGIEIVRVVLNCTLGGDPMAWLQALPLYLCSIQFITLPLAAFSHGRLKEASMDFVCIFGLIGMLMGTYCAGQNYACYPVISINNVASGITHSAAGFASLYIMLTGMAGMKRENARIAYGLIIGFSVAAYAVNLGLGSNYMFLMRGDGTPYDILYNWVCGNRVLYPLGVIALFAIYIEIFYAAFRRLRRK